MRVDPPCLIPREIEDEGPEPHPKCVSGHEKERLEDFNGVNVESVVDSDFAEHENDRKDVDRNVEEDGYRSECDTTLFGELLDCRVQDCPVNDDNDDVKDKASGIQELKQPQIEG